MCTTTRSVPDSPTSAPATDALILQKYAEIARYAVQLARNKIRVGRRADFDLEIYCDVCQAAAPHKDLLVHDESCCIGRTFRLAVEVANLRAQIARSIEYFATTTPQGEFQPARTVTHDEATREQAVTA